LHEGAVVALHEQGEDGVFFAGDLLAGYVADLGVFVQEGHVVAEDVHYVFGGGADAADTAAHAVYAVVGAVI